MKTILHTTGPFAGLPLSERPEAPHSRQRRFRNTGSEIISVPATQPFGFQTWQGEVEVTGYGVEILAGVDGTTTQVGGSTPQTHTVFVTFLIGSEKGSGAIRVERSFALDELYDGAVLPGRFERIQVRWVGSTADAPNVPLKLRIFAQPLRVVPVATPRPQGIPVLDFQDGRTFTQNATDLSTTLYDDSVASPQPLLYRDANAVLGSGIGGDFRMGPHFSLKRKIVGRVIFPVVIATAQYVVIVEAQDDAGTWHIWALYKAIDRPDTSITTLDSDEVQIVNFSSMDAAGDHRNSQNVGLWLPPKMRIRSVTNTAAQATLAGCKLWLSFVSEGG